MPQGQCVHACNGYVNLVFEHWLAASLAQRWSLYPLPFVALQIRARNHTRLSLGKICEKNPRGHGRPHKKAWLSATKRLSACGPGYGKQLFDARREVRPRTFNFQLFWSSLSEDSKMTHEPYPQHVWELMRCHFVFCSLSTELWWIFPEDFPAEPASRTGKPVLLKVQWSPFHRQENMKNLHENRLNLRATLVANNGEIESPVSFCFASFLIFHRCTYNGLHI